MIADRLKPGATCLHINNIGLNYLGLDYLDI